MICHLHLYIGQNYSLAILCFSRSYFSQLFPAFRLFQSLTLPTISAEPHIYLSTLHCHLAVPRHLRHGKSPTPTPLPVFSVSRNDITIYPVALKFKFYLCFFPLLYHTSLIQIVTSNDICTEHLACHRHCSKHLVSYYFVLFNPRNPEW